ncbi:hypothetical protein [methanotrophic endosymbiont of Bathymodiolus puteoserpentis (Logatchev)]|uniref:hypothetical protein n=1 Tax=methanotrophic endosymbiont of Bathymodiolus puteoserpentis (Logatchev) TaxID=343235 RepID=UPI0013C71C6E|nr:hypothetical protein [methanotrophic endosymbiont of Bathymodiolus puteoserpentis (Logatchev)]SHE22625.1 hypothetical protein BPUTEOMOX_2331 [methanotrophic endosymbiont of Bathymodiolus puteoserpentis (Logatchev)]
MHIPKLSGIIGRAKNDLSISLTSKRLSPETNQKIYSHIVELYSQTIKPAIAEPENTPQAPVEIISQEKEQITPAKGKTNDFDNVRIAFYIMRNNKRIRQVIAIDGFLINALESIGISKQNAPKWVQSQVTGWTAFDAQLPITRQVKCLIVKAVIEKINVKSIQG